MVKRIGRARRKTRHIMKKNVRKKGKISLSSFFQEFKNKDKVLLKAEPAVQKGIYFRRFHGKIGTIQGKKGNCYNVQITDGKKKKIVIVHPVHLKKV